MSLMPRGLPYPLSTVEPIFILGELAALAAKAGHDRVRRAVRRRRRGGLMRRPGAETPLWNALAAQVRRAARPYGRKAALARYLGLPRQRVTEFLSSRRRLPDGEIALRLLHWLETLRKGRDLTA